MCHSCSMSSSARKTQLVPTCTAQKMENCRKETEQKGMGERRTFDQKGSAFETTINHCETKRNAIVPGEPENSSAPPHSSFDPTDWFEWLEGGDADGERKSEMWLRLMDTEGTLFRDEYCFDEETRKIGFWSEQFWNQKFLQFQSFYLKFPILGGLIFRFWIEKVREHSQLVFLLSLKERKCFYFLKSYENYSFKLSTKLSPKCILH